VRDIIESLNDNAFLVYYDPSPLLPSSLLKNYLAKLRAQFNKHSVGVADGEVRKLRVLSVRDKLSSLTSETSLKDTFYMEFNFSKSSSPVD
jgi:hypothetical protein